MKFGNHCTADSFLKQKELKIALSFFDLMRKTYHVGELKSGIANWILQSDSWLRVKRIVQAGINYQLE